MTLSSRGHHNNWPAPFQDENGEWWFYEPEMGWTNQKRDKELYAKACPLLNNENPLKGKITICSVLEKIDDGKNKSFKELWDKSAPPKQ